MPQEQQPGQKPNQNQQNQNPKPVTPNQGQPGKSDDLANNEDRKADEPRRYDEADPNWRNPDVQMQNQLNKNPEDSRTDVNSAKDRLV
ncbi:MAG: hypothetical protein ACAH59_07245 [Pseudobdellovibrionaceae bacterium]